MEEGYQVYCIPLLRCLAADGVNTATLRAKFAAEWKQYEADADIMPNLRWMPTTSANPEEEHKVYWMNRLTLPVGDRFWDKHHPGDHWNCKCSLEQTDEPANPDVLSHIPDVKAQKGLAANPGKTGEMFDRSHPYYAHDCEHCMAYGLKGFKNSFFNSGEKKNCNLCSAMKKKVEDIIEMEELQKKTLRHIKEYNQSVDQYNGQVFEDESIFATGSLRVLRRSLEDVYEHSLEDANVMKWLQEYPKDAFKEWHYEGWAKVRHGKHHETRWFNYYSIPMNGKTYWANVKMHSDYNGEVLYTIEDDEPKDIIRGKHP